MAGVAAAPEKGDGVKARPTAASTDVSGQTRSARAQTRIKVYPMRDMVRACEFWLAQEVRPSGTYVVPRQHCWWTPKR